MSLLPVLNAAGVPILAFALFLLTRAFRQQIEVYKGSNDECKELVSSLQKEVQRLRSALESADSAYLKSMERVRELSRRSTLAANALSEAAKSVPVDDVLQIQVGESVSMLARLIGRLKGIEQRLLLNTDREAEEMIRSFYADLSEVAAESMIVRNPQARWALSVMMGGPALDDPSLDHLISRLRAELQQIVMSRPDTQDQKLLTRNDAELQREETSHGLEQG